MHSRCRAGQHPRLRPSLSQIKDIYVCNKPNPHEIPVTTKNFQRKPPGSRQATTKTPLGPSRSGNICLQITARGIGRGAGRVCVPRTVTSGRESLQQQRFESRYTTVRPPVHSLAPTHPRPHLHPQKPKQAKVRRRGHGQGEPGTH